MAEGGVDDRKLASLPRTFVPAGRLIRFPAKRGRRRLVLEYVAQSFEPGRRFPERYLVDEGLLSRDHGMYRRSGGWVDVLGGPA
jgi:hypothetical protein